jgi:two-component system sensor histidine kinase/response regulator
MTAPDTQSKGNVLIVDDTPANLQLLGGLLRDAGYKARPAPSGKVALQAATAELPDLVLLDINMPEMDGYEVCAKFKADEKLKHIPIIFISALTETDDKLKAFDAGGVDYVTKPFQAQEVRARVATHLTLRRLQQDLERRYDELHQLQDLRDNLIHMIVHDMRSPLMGIQALFFFLKKEAEALTPDTRELSVDAASATTTLVEMVSSLLDVSRLESGEMPLTESDVELGAVAEEAIGTLSGLTAGRSVTCERANGPVPSCCDADLIRRTVGNLLGNALKFTPSSASIVVMVKTNEGRPRVEVRDTGPGIPEQFHARIFDKFGQADGGKRTKRHSSGLGLAFCKLAVEAHGGTIGVDSKAGEGSTFWFELPK